MSTGDYLALAGIGITLVTMLLTGGVAYGRITSKLEHLDGTCRALRESFTGFRDLNAAEHRDLNDKHTDCERERGASNARIEEVSHRVDELARRMDRVTQ